MTVHYFIRLPDPAKARGSDSTLSFTAHAAEGFAEQLQDALRTAELFERWRGKQADPDEVDPALGATDTGANVTGQHADLHVDLVVDTSLPSEILKQRLRWLAGSGWQLRDVR